MMRMGTCLHAPCTPACGAAPPEAALLRLLGLLRLLRLLQDMVKMQDYLACKIDSAISGAVYEITDYLDEGARAAVAAQHACLQAIGRRACARPGPRLRTATSLFGLGRPVELG